MTGWPRGNKPVSEDEHVFSQYMETDLPAMEAAARADVEAGHEPIPLLVELKADDGSLRYTVVTGPRCDHTCPKCRQDIADARAEFGTGAIGVFNDSSGGEMEKLRQALNQLAGQLQKTLGPALQRIDALEEANKAKQLEDKT